MAGRVRDKFLMFLGAGAWRWVTCVHHLCHANDASRSADFPCSDFPLVELCCSTSSTVVALVWSCHPKLPKCEYAMALPAPAQQKPVWLRQGHHHLHHLSTSTILLHNRCASSTYHHNLPSAISYPDPPSPHGLGTRRNSRM